MKCEKMKTDINGNFICIKFVKKANKVIGIYEFIHPSEFFLYFLINFIHLINARNEEHIKKVILSMYNSFKALLRLC